MLHVLAVTEVDHLCSFKVYDLTLGWKVNFCSKHLFNSIMGHGNEIGIIPRFCEELFSRAEVVKDLNKVS